MDRYKFKNSKFSSASDAKKLRTLQAEDKRRLQRSNTFFQNRVLCTPNDKKMAPATLKPSTSKGQSMTAERSIKKFSKKEVSEISKLRYQKMLLFKQQKKEIKEHQMKKRQPVFHTGIYQPDQPSFLSGKKIDRNEMSSAKISSQSTSRLTGAGITPAVLSKKHLKFSVKTTSSQRSVPSFKQTNVSPRVTRSSKRTADVITSTVGNTNKKVKSSSKGKALLLAKNVPSVAFGRKPTRYVQRNQTPHSSFAPKNFKFSGIPGINAIDFNRTNTKKISKKKLKATFNKENTPVKDSIHLSPKTPASPPKSYLSPVQPQARVSFLAVVTPEICPELKKGRHLSSLRRKRMSKQATPLEKMFNNIDIDSPFHLTFSDEDLENNFAESNETLTDSEAELMALLKPSKAENAFPENDVWSSDLNEDDESPVKRNSIKKVKVTKSPKSIIKKELSKKENLSVSFVMKNTYKKNNRYKGTPLPRRSSQRVRLSLLPGLYDKDYSPPDVQSILIDTSKDLISFDTPKSSNKKQISRKMLVPTSPQEGTKGEELQIPATATRKNLDDTPLRRSARLSRINKIEFEM